VPAIDVDRETAHDAAARELANPIYPKPSWSDRIGEWLNDLLRRLMDTATTLPGGWLTLVVLTLLVLAALVVAARILRRTMGDGGTGRLYGSRVMSAADHRARADQSAAQGDWAVAIRQRVRAIGRQLEEDGVLAPVPGRTAGELAQHAGVAMPEVVAEFASAATIFNDVTYGQQPGTESDYRLVSSLDDRVRRHAAARP
jgi:hypothetical protein